VLLVAGTAVGVWMAVEKVFVDRWERQELANHAARAREGGSPGHGDPPPSVPTAGGRGDRNGTDPV
jgi:hypothetical protein